MAAVWEVCRVLRTRWAGHLGGRAAAWTKAWPPLGTSYRVRWTCGRRWPRPTAVVAAVVAVPPRSARDGADDGDADGAHRDAGGVFVPFLRPPRPPPVADAGGGDDDDRNRLCPLTAVSCRPEPQLTCTSSLSARDHPSPVRCPAAVAAGT